MGGGGGRYRDDGTGARSRHRGIGWPARAQPVHSPWPRARAAGVVADEQRARGRHDRERSIRGRAPHDHAEPGIEKRATTGKDRPRPENRPTRRRRKGTPNGVAGLPPRECLRPERRRVARCRRLSSLAQSHRGHRGRPPASKTNLSPANSRRSSVAVPRPIAQMARTTPGE